MQVVELNEIALLSFHTYSYRNHYDINNSYSVIVITVVIYSNIVMTGAQATHTTPLVVVPSTRTIWPALVVSSHWHSAGTLKTLESAAHVSIHSYHTFQYLELSLDRVYFIIIH